MNKSEELNALRSSLLQNDGSWSAGSNLIFELSDKFFLFFSSEEMYIQ